MFRPSQRTIEQSPRDQAVYVRMPRPVPQTIGLGLSLKIGSAIEAPLCPKGLILMCGEMGALSRDLTDWGERMKAATMVMSRNMPFRWLRRYAPRLDFMLVDSDYLGDVEATVDFCLQVRRAVPALPLILVSSEVRSHDFTCERMMACDATLKPPVLHSALTMGVQAAYQNNEHYRQVQG